METKKYFTTLVDFLAILENLDVGQTKTLYKRPQISTKHKDDSIENFEFTKLSESTVKVNNVDYEIGSTELTNDIFTSNREGCIALSVWSEHVTQFKHPNLGDLELTESAKEYLDDLIISNLSALEFLKEVWDKYVALWGDGKFFKNEISELINLDNLIEDFAVTYYFENSGIEDRKYWRM